MGKFRLEHFIKRGYFISNKLYAFKNKENKTVIISKGVKSGSLTLKDFEELFENHSFIYANRKEILSSYNKKSITILDKKVRLNFNSYLKR